MTTLFRRSWFFHPMMKIVHSTHPKCELNYKLKDYHALKIEIIYYMNGEWENLRATIFWSDPEAYRSCLTYPIFGVKTEEMWKKVFLNWVKTTTWRRKPLRINRVRRFKYKFMLLMASYPRYNWTECWLMLNMTPLVVLAKCDWSLRYF